MLQFRYPSRSLTRIQAKCEDGFTMANVTNKRDEGIMPHNSQVELICHIKRTPCKKWDECVRANNWCEIGGKRDWDQQARISNQQKGRII